MPLPPREKYIDDTDELIIEDESQRVALKGKIPTQACVTGKTMTNCCDNHKEDELNEKSAVFVKMNLILLALI